MIDPQIRRRPMSPELNPSIVDQIAKVRGFDRSDRRQIGLLEEGSLKSEISILRAHRSFEEDLMRQDRGLDL